jgi:hypothetical protein
MIENDDHPFVPFVIFVPSWFPFPLSPVLCALCALCG